MSRPLPPHPSLRQLRIQARELLEAFRAGDPQAVRRVRESLPRLAGAPEEKLRAPHLCLRDAQLVMAREYGFPSWPKLVAALQEPSRTQCRVCGRTAPEVRLLHLGGRGGRLCHLCLSAADQVLEGRAAAGWRAVPDSACILCRRPASWGVTLAASDDGGVCLCGPCARLMGMSLAQQRVSDEQGFAYFRSLGAELYQRHSTGDPHALRRVRAALPGWRRLSRDDLRQAPLDLVKTYRVLFHELAPPRTQERNPPDWRSCVQDLQFCEEGPDMQSLPPPRQYLLEQVERLLAEHAHGRPQAARRIKAVLPDRSQTALRDILASPLSRAEAQAVVTRELGATDWQELLAKVEVGAVPHGYRVLCKWLPAEAAQIARDLGDGRARVEHLLLALVRSSRAEIRRVLDALHVEREAVEQSILKELGGRRASGSAGPPAPTGEDEAQRQTASLAPAAPAPAPADGPDDEPADDLAAAFAAILREPSRAAHRSAVDLDMPRPNAGHLFLALLVDPGSAGARVLAAHGADLERVRAAVRECHQDERDGLAQAFTDGFRRAMRRAGDETTRLGDNYVGTQHLLLAIMHETDGPGATLLADLGADFEALERTAERYSRPEARHTPAGERGADAPKIPWTPRAEQVITEGAPEEARAVAARQIGTQHLLLALLHDVHGVAAEAMAACGVRYEAALARAWRQAE
ncbi:MAG: Clp protease N-terminal domain-containing protein [Candidatus Latescibacterota bacterium]